SRVTGSRSDHLEPSTEARPESRHEVSSFGASGQGALQDKQDGSGGHIAEVSQYLARHAHGAGRHLEAFLQGIENLGAAGVADRAGKLSSRKTAARQEGIEQRLELRADEGGDVAREEHAKPILLHAPAHDVEGIGKCVFGSITEVRAIALG